ncbi:MAG: DUF819 family protein [Desulfobacula sp.]|jgi:uncharacterized membrane protein|nr:DUF819 family protein [Desulfobacula sp.]
MVLLAAFYVFFPVIVIHLCQRFEKVNKIGAVFVCYVIGALLGNSIGLPDGSLQLQDTLNSASVAIALPLLLFSMDVKAWLKTAGKAILSMTGATIIIVAVAGLGSVIIADHVEESWKMAGLAISVYTGGTPNMAAIKTALDVDPTTYIIMHTYDTLISLVYIIFCITIAQKLLNRFLPRFEKIKGIVSDSQEGETEDIHSYRGMFKASVLKQLIIALVLSFLILGTALGASGIFPKAYSTAITILMITSLGIGASFITKVRKIEKTYQLGMYFILIFCLVVGSMANIKDLIHINWILMFYISFCIFGTVILHAIFCKIFKIDTDTFIITSISAICSPPFVPVVAQALKNKQIILSGLTTGIIGYAIGNYLGISFAYIFKIING